MIDVQGSRVFIFQLDENKQYQLCEASTALSYISVELLEQTIEKALLETNRQAAIWFTQQLKKQLKSSPLNRESR